MNRNRTSADRSRGPAGPALNWLLAVPNRIEVRALRKTFGSTVALDGVDLSVAPAVVHAIIGENGAGKSTLMKILSGVFRADAGRMMLDGQPYSPSGPLEARRRGVVMIYQDLALAPHLPVADNILLGMEPARRGWIRRQQLEEQAGLALATLGHADISAAAPVSSLSVGAQQIVELARALVVDARVVVLDEPTSSLAAADVPKLFDVVRRLRDRGVSVLYISHFLEEIEEIASEFTVLRDGRSVGSGRVDGRAESRPIEENAPANTGGFGASAQRGDNEQDAERSAGSRAAGRDRIIEMMVGRQISEMFPRLPHAIGESVLELTSLAARGVRCASLVLRRGEILGIAGLIGAGRTEMLRAIFGLAPVRDGLVRVAAFTGTATPAVRLEQGAGLLSEDRKGEGLAQSLSVADNLTLSRLGSYSRHGWLDRSAQRKGAAEWIGRLGIKTAGPQAPVSSLSGGNQQKVAIARLLHHDCDILLLDEPTRGIDIASKAQIYDLVGRLAQAGKAILFVSSYLPELLGICDTIAVMCRGRLGEAAPVSEWSEHAIMAAATGTSEQAAARTGIVP